MGLFYETVARKVFCEVGTGRERGGSQWWMVGIDGSWIDGDEEEEEDGSVVELDGAWMDGWMDQW